MAAIKLEWQNLNGRRAFPLDDAATRLSAAGLYFPDDLLSSAVLRFPNTVGTRAAVSGMTISPRVVSITFVALDASDVATPIAALTVQHPVDVGRPYLVSAVYPGVSGWVCFADGVRQATAVRSWRFDHPEDQSVLLLSQATAYPPLPIPGLMRPDSDAVLTGLVNLQGQGDLVIEGADRILDESGVLQRVILLRLNLEGNPLMLYEYAGPCADRPESHTCDFTPISQISGVAPDENGNITLIFEDPFVLSYPEGPFVEVNFPVSLLEACEFLKRKTRPDPADATIRDGWVDQCNTQWYSVPGPEEDPPDPW